MCPLTKTARLQDQPTPSRIRRRASQSHQTPQQNPTKAAQPPWALKRSHTAIYTTAAPPPLPETPARGRKQHACGVNRSTQKTMRTAPFVAQSGSDACNATCATPSHARMKSLPPTGVRHMPPHTREACEERRPQQLSQPSQRSRPRDPRKAPPPSPTGQKGPKTSKHSQAATDAGTALRRRSKQKQGQQGRELTTASRIAETKRMRRALLSEMTRCRSIQPHTPIKPAGRAQSGNQTRPTRSMQAR